MSGSNVLKRALFTLLLLLVAAPVAVAEDRLTIRGAGFGHGVGMSQYGAKGLAENGSSYRDILAHYYTGTRVDPSGAGKVVRVLLQAQRGQGQFTGATRAAGRRLNPATTYRVRRGPSGTVDLLSPKGRRMKRVAAPLVISSSNPLVLKGKALNFRTNGAYRGTLEFRPGYLGVQAVNAVTLEDYVRGVVGDEMPPSWHPEALKAQAVAARTYAVTTSKAGTGFEHYPDTRSQVYGGVAAETPSVDAAVLATAGELVTLDGKPVVTYFFSTSGGRTEDVENTSLGNAPLPWLKSVEDPYDDVSPRHRWGPIRLTLAQARKKLGNLVKGDFRGIKVTKRGKSPRVVTAEVVGSEGRVATTGAMLRARLGLFDTWAYFTSVSSGEEEAPAEEEPPRTDSTGGVTPKAMAARKLGRAIGGRVFPYSGEVHVERRVGRRWVRVGVADAGRRGRYSFAVGEAGKYRIRFRGEHGPVVQNSLMATWTEIEAEAPDLVLLARRLFDAHVHKTIATLRRDGSPRISGIEIQFAGEQLYFGSMPRAVKALDLLRDGRFALHSGSSDPWEGDAKIAGLAVEVGPGDERAAVLGDTFGDSHLFRADISELSVVRLGEPRDHLVIESWHPGRGVTSLRR